MLERYVNYCCELLSKLPLECMQYNFMQMALLATIFLAPLTATAGVQVVNYRMAFFADTIGHSVFAGAALGAIFLGAAGPVWGMPITALLIGLGVLFLQKQGKHSADTIIGVFFAFIVSLGLLLTGSVPNLAKLAGQFIFGDILLVTAQDTVLLALLSLIYLLFTTFSYNALLLIAIDEDSANAHRIKSDFYSYLHVSLLALIVIFTVKITGVLLAGAMLIVPAAAARNLAKRAGSMYFYAAVTGLISGMAGLIISAQDWANFPAGAAMVMTSCILFAASLIWKKLAAR